MQNCTQMTPHRTRRRADAARSRDPARRRAHLHPRPASRSARARSPSTRTPRRLGGHDPQRHGRPRGAGATSSSRTPRPAACRAGAGYHLYIESLMETAAMPAGASAGASTSSSAGGERGAERLIARPRSCSPSSPARSASWSPRRSATPSSRPSTSCRCRAAACSASWCPRAGFVENKLIEIEEELSREELVRISNYLTENFRGLTPARRSASACSPR